MNRNYHYVWNASAFNAVDPATTDSLMGNVDYYSAFVVFEVKMLDYALYFLQWDRATTVHLNAKKNVSWVHL